MLFARIDDDAARIKCRSLGKIGVEAGTSGEVALRPQESRCLQLHFAVIEPRRCIVVNDKDAIFEKKGAPLELVRRGYPGAG